MTSTRKARIIYNPTAGQYSIAHFIPSVIQALKTYGWEAEARASQSGEHVTELAQEAARRGAEAVFAVGGDGTINAAVRGLVGTQTALGILPAGTSNVFARDLGLLPFSLPRWWRLTHNAVILAQSSTRAVDVGLCNQTPFLMWAGIGLDALSVNQLEPRPRYQKYMNVPVYAYSALTNMLSWHGQPLEIEVNGQIVQGHYLLAVFNNTRRYLGGLAVLSNDGFIDDGLSDLWLFPGKNLQDALLMALQVIQGRHIQSESIRCLKVRSARIRSSAPFPLQVDGEPLGYAPECHFTLQHHALRLLTPPSAEVLFLAEQAREATL